MFRPWPNQAQPDRSWATFNNAAGNRININNFGLHPRGHAAPAFMNPEPRLFNFSQLFNITTNNFGPVPLRPNQPGRLRNRVTVVLPDGSRVLLERDLLHEHLPRTRNFMQRGLFPVPEFLRGYDDGFMGTLIDPRYFEHAFARGTTFVFRHLEGLCQSYTSPYGGAGAAGGGGAAFDLFARPRYLLANARDRGVTVREIFWHVFILCCVLDQDRAFGCSDLLARPIAEFLVDFLPSVEAFLPPLAMQILFVGYARIFRESVFELEVLKQMWESMDVMDQTHIRGMMGPQLATNGMGNNAQRVWTALRHLGLV
ncbi:hypothetical protein CORC01_01793 [Colletotrichum orchidophilum]|uniref:Uncharacterized protein n=1 Tax=Colletotrichum orchidophilum TaxID=1209926 RepID=A0A1G4BP03_9PEZI|nr:uncharacterized protein CORC01_01793 [Colletotrichum orchidophilum]OHF03035.1 hypothetical protein CORC01_01793 [Colletotrichum orchidophilum]